MKWILLWKRPPGDYKIRIIQQGHLVKIQQQLELTMVSIQEENNKLNKYQLSMITAKMKMQNYLVNHKKVWV